MQLLITTCAGFQYKLTLIAVSLSDFKLVLVKLPDRNYQTGWNICAYSKLAYMNPNTTFVVIGKPLCKFLIHANIISC